MDESKTTHREHSEETLKIALEMQRREATAGAVYASLARRMDGRGGEMLMRVANEKTENAKAISRYTGKKSKPPLLRTWGWRLLSRLFGSSFAISHLEAGESEARPFFTAIADEIPEAVHIGEIGEQHRAQLREILNTSGLRGIDALVTNLYGVMLFIFGALAGFLVVLKDPRATGRFGVCAAVAAVLAAAVTGFTSQKGAAGRQRPLATALVASALAVLVAVPIVAPFFTCAGVWSSLAFSFAAAAVVSAVLAFFAAVARQETCFFVFAEMLALTAGAALLSSLAVWIAKAWFWGNA